MSDSKVFSLIFEESRKKSGLKDGRRRRKKDKRRHRNADEHGVIIPPVLRRTNQKHYKTVTHDTENRNDAEHYWKLPRNHNSEGQRRTEVSSILNTHDLGGLLQDLRDHKAAPTWSSPSLETTCADAISPGSLTKYRLQGLVGNLSPTFRVRSRSLQSRFRLNGNTEPESQHMSIALLTSQREDERCDDDDDRHFEYLIRSVPSESSSIHRGIGRGIIRPDERHDDDYQVNMGSSYGAESIDLSRNTGYSFDESTVGRAYAEATRSTSSSGDDNSTVSELSLAGLVCAPWDF